MSYIAWGYRTGSVGILRRERGDTAWGILRGDTARAWGYHVGDIVWGYRVGDIAWGIF